MFTVWTTTNRDTEFNLTETNIATETDAVIAARKFIADHSDAPLAAAHVRKNGREDHTFTIFLLNGNIIERWGLYEICRKYRVHNVGTVEEFLDRYYKRDRITHMLKDYPDYRETLLASRRHDLATKGYTIISHHDSVTGEVVAFYA